MMQRTSVCGQMILRDCNIEGNQRYSWTKNTIGIGQPNPAPAPPLQHDQLLSEHRDFSLEPRERRDQDGQNEAEEPDHPTSLSDSLFSSME
jgi:hypothetical protein